MNEALTVTEFVTARLDGYELDLRQSRIEDMPEWWAPDDWSRERGLAQCAAMRKIVELHGPRERSTHGGIYCDICDAYEVSEGLWVGGDLYPCDTIRAVASIWSYHPDFREEWSI